MLFPINSFKVCTSKFVASPSIICGCHTLSIVVLLLLYIAVDSINIGETMAYSPPTRAPIVLRSIIYCSNLHLQGNMRPYFQYRLCIFMLLLLLLLSLWHRQHLLSPFPRSTAVFHSCFIQPFQVCFEKMHPKWLQNDPEDSSFKKST